MRDLRELDIKDSEPLPAPSDPLVEAFESHFGYKLPVDYLTLLRFSNGGHPRLETCSVHVDGGADYVVGISHFFHLTEDRADREGLWWSLQEVRGILGPGQLPFADDGLGDLFVVDCAASPQRIGIAWHDERLRITWLAESFSAFIDSLWLDENMMY
jgi:hypothetical protein